LPEDLVVLGETVDVVLAEDHLAVDHDVKDASSTLDQSRLDTAVVLDRGGQTGRLGFVVSLHAVGDRNLHPWSAPWLSVTWGVTG
jgi:hypothetical protein